MYVAQPDYVMVIFMLARFVFVPSFPARITLCMFFGVAKKKYNNIVSIAARTRTISREEKATCWFLAPAIGCFFNVMQCGLYSVRADRGSSFAVV